MNKELRVILASASPRRKNLMEQMGYEIMIMPSYLEEKVSVTAPDEVVKELSKMKCFDIAGRCKGEGYIGNSIFIGADTVVSVDGNILGKPDDESVAEKMLRVISGRNHEVYTGVTVVLTEDEEIIKSETFVVKTEVWVSELSDEDIKDYIASGEPMGKAGAYGIQGSFGKYVEGIKGDYYNVVGLPICELNKVIRGMLNDL